MKTFYSAEDIEALVARGQAELVLDDDTVLTQLARDAAQRLGLKLVRRPSAAPASLRTYSWIKTFSATAEKNSRDQTLTAEGTERKRSTSDRASATSSSDIFLESIDRKAGSSSAAASM